MGIDAEMLIRKVPASIVTDEWLKEKSWLLCQSIGASKFFLSDGMPSPEYAVANKAWLASYESHPMYSAWVAGNREVRKQIIADIGEAPEERRLAIDRTLSRYREDDDPAPGSMYRQDGDDVPADPGECLLELSLMGRYYGPGYERGDILTYCAIAEWLEQNIPGCVVYYGGDSSGVCAEPFDYAKRAEYRALLYSKNGRDYFNYSSDTFPHECAAMPAACSLCPGGKYHGSRNGFGNNYAAYSCAGCGKRVQTHDNGKTWSEDKD